MLTEWLVLPLRTVLFLVRMVGLARLPLKRFYFFIGVVFCTK